MIYSLSGPACASQLVCSLWSLRQHYDGPVTVFATPDARPLAEVIRQDQRLRIDVQATQRFDDCPRPHWVTKAFTYLQSPYKYTIYLDADTLVSSDIHPMFGRFVVAKCNDLRILDKHQYPNSVRRQMFQFRKFGPVFGRMLDDTYKANLHIANNGVLAFQRDHPVLREMHHLAMGFRQLRLHDELALNMLLCYYPDVQRVDGRWNALVRYQDGWPDVVVAHFHHKTSFQNDRGRAMFGRHLREAIEADAGGIAVWGGKENDRIRALRASIGLPHRDAESATDRGVLP